MDQFKQENVDILALSVDFLDKAKSMGGQVKATFPIAYGLEVPRDADKVGAYWEDRRKIIHATNFIIDPERRVTQACFATGPIGRIVAENALRSIQGTKKRKAQGN